jgi:hypothetical protein
VQGGLGRFESRTGVIALALEQERGEDDAATAESEPVAAARAGA